MSSDEVYQKRYNIQPNPYKGAQASVLSRFGQQAQNLAGISGTGSANAVTAKAKTEATARMAKLAMSLAKTQSDAQSRLTRIGQEMDRDQLQNQKEIADAKIAQSEERNVLEDIASGLTLYHGITGLARGIDTATGGEESSELDKDTYQASYDFNTERLMQVEGVDSPDQLSDESLKEAHRIAIAEARPKQGIGGKAADVVGDVLEAIPIAGRPLRDLRKQNVAAAEARKLVQQNIMTPDMARKFTNELSDSISRRIDIFGRPYEVPVHIQQTLLYSATNMLEMLYSGMWTDFDLFMDHGIVTPDETAVPEESVDTENTGG